MEHLLSRKKLFDLILARPIKDIAPEFGISDVALAKVCRQHQIPLPGRGYWAKLKAGKSVPPPSLPPRGLGMHETVRIGRQEWQGREAEETRLMAEEIPPAPEFTESLAELTERVAKNIGKVTYVRDLNRTHGAISRLLEEDAKRIEKRSEPGYSAYFDKPYFVSPYERRRLKLLNSIFLALGRLDVSTSVQGKNPSQFSIRVGNTDVNFSLDAPNPKQQREERRPVSDERRAASEPIQLSISWYLEKQEGVRLVWDDRGDAPIEDSLQEIVVGLVVAGEMQYRAGELSRHAYAAERKATFIEAARKREEEIRKKERECLRRLEKARIEKLFDDAMSLRLANDLRGYVETLQEANRVASEPTPEKEMAQWVAWALAQAERIDPVLNKSFLQLPDDPGEEPKADQRPVSATDRGSEAVTEPAWHPNRWYTRLHR